MNATYLTNPTTGKPTDISICGECGKPARGKTNFDISQKCCTCYHCGGPLNAEDKTANSLYHRACDDTRRASVDARRLSKAEVVEDYDGPVYCEGVPGGSFGDGYFADVHELAESLDDGSGIEFAYCCTSSPVAALDLDSILESATEEAFEDARHSLRGVDELREAVDVFNTANEDVLSWDWDVKRKVRVPRAQVTTA